MENRLRPWVSCYNMESAQYLYNMDSAQYLFIYHYYIIALSQILSTLHIIFVFFRIFDFQFIPSS